MYLWYHISNWKANKKKYSILHNRHYYCFSILNMCLFFIFMRWQHSFAAVFSLYISDYIEHFSIKNVFVTDKDTVSYSKIISSESIKICEMLGVMGIYFIINGIHTIKINPFSSCQWVRKISLFTVSKAALRFLRKSLRGSAFYLYSWQGHKRWHIMSTCDSVNMSCTPIFSHYSPSNLETIPAEHKPWSQPWGCMNKPQNPEKKRKKTTWSDLLCHH